MEKEELENRDKYLVKELNKIAKGITFSEHFKDYDWHSIRNGCQIEFDFYIKELDKGSDLGNLIFRFENSVNEIDDTYANSNDLNKYCIYPMIAYQKDFSSDIVNDADYKYYHDKFTYD